MFLIKEPLILVTSKYLKDYDQSIKRKLIIGVVKVEKGVCEKSMKIIRVIEHNGKKFFIKEDMGMCFYTENREVFAVPLQENGEPHDDEGVTTNVDDFDLSQEDIGKLKHMIQMVLGSHNSQQNGNNSFYR